MPRKRGTGGIWLRQRSREVFFCLVYPNQRLGNGAEILSQPHKARRANPCPVSQAARDAAAELGLIPVGIAGLNPRLLVKAQPPGRPERSAAPLAPWQAHLEVLLGYRSLNPGACGIIWCLRSCQIPGDQQVFPPEVTSNPAPPSADQNIRVGSVLGAPLGAGRPQWGAGVGSGGFLGAEPVSPLNPSPLCPIPSPRSGT